MTARRRRQRRKQESEDIRKYATVVRSNVRNKWAHQEDMSGAVFGECVAHVMKLVGAMPLDDVAGGGLMGAAAGRSCTASEPGGRPGSREVSPAPRPWF